MPGIGTTGIGAPRLLYFGRKALNEYRPKFLGLHIMVAITNITTQINMKAVRPYIINQFGDRFSG
jgi:hypothetical protein